MTTRNLEPDQWGNTEQWCLVSGRRRQLLKTWDTYKSNKIVNSLEWFTFHPFIIPCLIEHKDQWGIWSVLIFRLKLILTLTWVGTAYKAIPWSLLDGSMWIGIIFNFSYRTGTNLPMKHSVFISVTGLWTKYIKLMTQNVIYYHQNPIHMNNMLKLVFESDTSHAWNRSGNHNTLCRMYLYLIILAMNILD